jgi:exonuclease III
VVLGDLNTPLSPIDRSSKQKLNKEILDLNHTIDQMDLADVYRIFHPTSAQYTFFSEAHGTFSKFDHTLGHKASLSKYKKKNNPMHSILSQCIKTRTQQHKQQ